MRPGELRALVLALAAGVLVLAVSAAAASALDISFGDLSREPQAVLRAPWYLGAVSGIGVLVWWGGAVACLFAGATRDDRLRAPLLATGALGALLAADDLFLIHERALPDDVGVPQNAVLGVYGLLALAYAWRFRAFLLRTDVILLGAAVALFAASLAIDVVAGRYGFDDDVRLPEDGTKLLAIVVWSTWAWRAAAAAALSSGSAPTRDAAPRA